ncbi:MAG: ABC transporter permease subunit [Thermodesulfobacteriota bacterium]
MPQTPFDPSLFTDRRQIQRRQRLDRLARQVITLGGILVIGCVLAIIVLIARVALPLFLPPATELVREGAVSPEPGGGDVLLAGVDETMAHAYLLRADGAFLTFRLADGQETHRERLRHPGGDEAATVRLARADRPRQVVVLWSDGAISVLSLSLAPVGERPILAEAVWLLPGDGAGPAAVRAAAAGSVEEGLTVAVLRADNRILVHRRGVKTDLFGDQQEVLETAELAVESAAGAVTELVLSAGGEALYAGTAGGRLLHWPLDDLEDPRLQESAAAGPDRPITALALVLGSQSLAVGDGQGGLATWMPVPFGDAPGEGKRLQPIHRLSGHDGAVTRIIASERDKSLLSLDASGAVHLDHMTSERRLVRLDSQPGLSLWALAPRNNGLLGVAADGRYRLWTVEMPHPEVSWRTLFAPVWYEGYDRPAHAWQSSAANDDYEPKLGIVPLIFGTFKGTLYAMALAVPLALLGAVYISQFAGHRTRALVKPVVEVMASVPSVVLGFLAALWLAPLVEGSLVGVILATALLPAAFFLIMMLWRLAQRHGVASRARPGTEFLWVMPVIVAVVWLGIAAGPRLEAAWLGDFKLWLYEHLGVRYDQRNAVIIAFGLGFCVIPIIFSIAEDALSSIPGSLTAASLALGASRWQTVWKVILPSASPGIFAGLMIGLGRAVGETMVVLMATGNTAIMDLAPWNGMRTLAANIAVEVPEAPFGGTLYRVLFLCAVILFLLTFVINTTAELVRERLRRKYVRY